MCDTRQLYDYGEESWPVKLHMGCGGIYLDGYINIDVQCVRTDDVDEELLEAQKTTIDKYYKRDASWYNLPKRNIAICDLRSDIMDLDYLFEQESVDKIVGIQVLEHLGPTEFTSALGSFCDLLRPNGVLVISVPDMLGTLKWIEEGDEEKVKFALRHLRGTWKDEWSYHKSWWTKETLEDALDWAGFRSIQWLDNFHAYPALVVRAKKLE